MSWQPAAVRDVAYRFADGHRFARHAAREGHALLADVAEQLVLVLAVERRLHQHNTCHSSRSCSLRVSER